ncbi:MAG: hypothetical protein K9W43_13380 [Candidatus Thorarchaeota archaeon]|nr:hypothetical protein [Candidatus Thorarchaeota archaeon]
MFEERPVDNIGSKYPKLTITVYTNDHCVFCKQAIKIVKETANRCIPLAGFLNVIEQDVNSIEQEKKEHINAVPTIEVGEMTFVGLPSVEDMEYLINQALLTALTP